MTIMSSNTTEGGGRYVVYMPYGEMAVPCPIHVCKDSEVKVLRDKIRKDDNFKHYLENEDLILFKCDELSLKGASFYSGALGWLRDHPQSRNLIATYRLKQYFPTGPAPEKDGKIDVIAVTPSILEAVRRPTTPKNKASQASDTADITPCRPVSETQELVDNFFERYDRELEEYLLDLPWKDFWEVPRSADPATACFVDSLNIPQISGVPMLVLHDLGGNIVDESIVKELFTNGPRFLVNTSGSGKTRLLFEGLTRHWGFYFTANADSTNLGLGSSDMMDTIREHIPRTRCFVKEPQKLNKRKCDDAYDSNNYIAKRRVHQVLTARVLVFEHFLKIARKNWPERPINEFKKHWLFLRLCSMHILAGDVFAGLSEVLHDASDEYLMMTKKAPVSMKLVNIQEEFGLNGYLYLILDEAQVATRRLDGCFRSEKDKLTKHSVLRPIVKSLQESSQFPIIISGTGLSMDAVNDTVGSAVGKVTAFIRVTRTGAFDDRKHQVEYIKRYLPRHIAESEPGREFLRRSWNWVRGRHRFTASLVVQLLLYSFRSPHRILNAYVEAFCKFSPSDGERFVAKEEDIGVHLENIMPFSFTQIRGNTELVDFFSDILYTWLIHQTPIPLSDKEKELVELGLARFVDQPDRKASVDEPLVLLAATQEFWNNPRFSFAGYLKERIKEAAGRGEHFEKLTAYYLASAFNGDTRLCDILEFGTHVPQWAKQRAELVSVSWSGEKAEISRFHLRDFVGAVMAIGCKCSTEEETVKWFENPSTLMCFPDKYMGPDIVLFVRLEDGLILTLVVQNKWRSEEHLKGSELLQAAAVLDPSKFYKREGLKGQKYADAGCRILEAVKRLNDPCTTIESEEWLKDEMPVLRVIAAYPASAEQLSAPCVSLKMDVCEELIDEDGTLNAVARSLGIKRAAKRAAEDDIGSISKKRR